MERLVLSVLLTQLIPLVVTTSVSLFRMDADTSNNWNKGYPYNKTVLSEEDCKLMCLREDECKAITHYVLFGINTCSLYKKAQTETRPPSDKVVVAGIGNKVFTKACGKDLQEPFSPPPPAAPELRLDLHAEPIIWTSRYSVSGKLYAKLKLSNDQRFSYSTSKLLCHAFGGKLPEPRTQRENHVLAHISRTRIWLGMKNKDGKGNLMWESDNSSVAWLNWERQGRETGHISALRTRGLDVDHCPMILNEPYLKNNDTLYRAGWDAFRGSDTVSIVVCEKQKHWTVTDPQTNKQYTTVDESRPYDQSKAFCASIGGILPEPKSQKENDFVAALSDTSFWLGMNDEDEEGKWVWDSDGSYVNWTFWQKKDREPNGEKRENCASILKNGYPRNESAWADRNCNRRVGRVVCQKELVCRNTECKNAAERISRNLNTSVNPCDDMYEFSCGGWVKKNPIPDDKQAISVFGLLRKKNKNIIKALLEKEILEDYDDIKSELEIKALYQSCMSLDVVNYHGDKNIKALLMEQFGGWPIITPEWSSQDFNLVDMMVKLTRLNQWAVLYVTVHVDEKNSNKNILYISQTSLGLGSREYYIVPRNDSKLTVYQNYIEGVARQMGGATVDLEAVKRDAEAIVNFEIELAKISKSAEYGRDRKALYNIQTLTEVHGNYSSAVFDWRNFVTSVMKTPGVGVTDITDEEKICNQVPGYHRNLTQLLKVTAKRTLSNYLLWRLVMDMANYLGDDYRKNMTAWGEYRTIVYGTKSEAPREEKCLDEAKLYGKEVLGRMFIENNLKPGAKDDIKEMIQNVQASFDNTIDKLEWMDAETKRAAKTKNAKISYKIGYPDFIRNDTYMDEKFGHYSFDADDYFGNILKWKKKDSATRLGKLRQPIDKKLWFTSAMTTNAYYSRSTNAIIFPAGILLPPFYSGDFPKYLNYGAIGYVVGHEVTHGFDDAGSLYDGEGNLVNWWSAGARAEFENRSQCMVDQYGNFTIPELNMTVNGNMTLGENIADNAGLKESFRAYRQWVKGNGRGEEPLLPGLKYTPNQLFFINHYQTRCRSERQQYALKNLRTDSHSPGRFRTIGTAQNSEDFAKAFHCPVGSPMNPSKKCSVW